MNVETIIGIHDYLTDFFVDSEDPISPPGVKSRDTIESAASRPYATAGGHDAYPTIFLKAASLFHSITCNHSFNNGNKRATLLSTLYFLSEHGYLLDRCDDEEMYEFTRKIAAHEICVNRKDEVAVIAEWLESNSRKQIKGEKPMKLNELRDSLSRFDYTLEDDGIYLNVIDTNGNYVERILKRGAQGKDDYDQQYISGIRKRLQLTAEYGVDSARFYGHKGLTEDLGDFMRMRIEVMRRLAKI
ncbi:type II toxin-antitoxin system death-on-curing family toxin [Chitinibacter tainanensis]|uniref:type II toxin-antitoxin system death-on-curing family toxin n=1 Tax=Chitinibacter tainanensis TaxID=230667 RepID=UPI002352BCDD|nr:type II toxin-antitoxin system death-on-curing family toxin [Chitinibacter tainanensis]